MNISPINIYSNYNTPGFGVSLKTVPNKKVTAKDAAKVLAVPATICMAVITGKSGKNGNMQDKSVKIGNNELYIDSDGHLTQVPPNERSEGYYILSKDNKTPIYKLPSGKLMSPQDAVAEPVMAVDVLKDEIIKTDNENIYVEAQIKNWETAIKDKIKDTDEKVADINAKTRSLEEYLSNLEKNSSSLKNISEKDLRIFFDKNVEFWEKPADSFYHHRSGVCVKQKEDGIALCRSLTSEIVASLLYKPITAEITDTKGFMQVTENKTEINKTFDEITDIDSLLAILQEKRNILAKNQSQLKITEEKVQNTDKSCDERVNLALEEVKATRKNCLAYEKSIRNSHIFSETYKTVSDQAQKDFENLRTWVIMRSFRSSDRAAISDASRWDGSDWCYDRTARKDKLWSMIHDRKARCFGEVKSEYKKGVRVSAEAVADIQDRLTRYYHDSSDYSGGPSFRDYMNANVVNPPRYSDAH